MRATAARHSGTREAGGQSVATAIRHSSLRLGRPGDAHEREADRFADAVAKISPMDHADRFSSPASRVTTRVGHGSGGVAAPPIVASTLAGAGGRPLDARSRAWFEPLLGHDLSRVRLYTGPQAARSASAIGARAYTVGHEIVFGDGQYPPAGERGRRLLGHELAHVVQQGGQGTLVQRDLIYGGGYANPFAGNPAAETAAAQKNPREWFPSSVDFKETATLSGGGKGLSTLAGLIQEIGSKSVGSVTDIDLIGHANADLFALGGKLTRTSVTGSQGGTIGATQLAAVQADIDKVRDRFAPAAHITLYGCNSGASGSLLQAISAAFKVCARGFKDPISWCLGWQTNPLVIKSRGRTLINPPDGTPCDSYNGSVYTLTTDREDCSGKRPKAPDIELPKRKPTVPEVPD